METPSPVLVADDDPAVLRLAVRLFQKQGLPVRTASGGEQLLELWMGLRARVVLSDVQMPGRVDGIAACLSIRARDPRTRLFLMSGDPAAKERVESCGLELAFLKPFATDEFERWIRSLS